MVVKLGGYSHSHILTLTTVALRYDSLIIMLKPGPNLANIQCLMCNILHS